MAVRLNLGGGDQRISGFINVDLCPEADIKHDLRLPLPYEDGSVDEIIAIHVIESFYKWNMEDIMKDWRRVLKPDGKLTIEFTDLNDTIDLYLHGGSEDHKRGYWGLYGNQDNPIDPIVLHHYVWTKEDLTNLLISCGFTVVTLTRDGVVHWPPRDWRIICN